MKSKLAVACVILAFCAVGAMGVYFAYKRVMLHLFVDHQFGKGDEADLIYAAMDGDEGKLKSYLAKGVSIDAYNPAKQYNPLCVAIVER
ncbi:MAG TPA: hypothetical protein VG733_13130, partial [Chthoniobacteraceae bacterium]|nr:hypothetical protein [Chthoniobacteraceae bacterium]